MDKNKRKVVKLFWKSIVFKSNQEMKLFARALLILFFGFFNVDFLKAVEINCSSPVHKNMKYYWLERHIVTYKDLQSSKKTCLEEQLIG